VGRRVPDHVRYQWKRCDAGDPLNGTCGTSRRDLELLHAVAADAGKRLRIQVTATNAQGSPRRTRVERAVIRCR